MNKKLLCIKYVLKWLEKIKIKKVIFAEIEVDSRDIYEITKII